MDKTPESGCPVSQAVSETDPQPYTLATAGAGEGVLWQQSPAPVWLGTGPIVNIPAHLGHL